MKLKEYSEQKSKSSKETIDLSSLKYIRNEVEDRIIKLSDFEDEDQSSRIKINSLINDIKNNSFNKKEVKEILYEIINLADDLNINTFEVYTKVKSKKQSLRKEVEELLVKSINGQLDIPPYNRKEHGNPLSYLEKYYGRFLKKFNKEEDYFYQPDLEKIDRKFRNNLRMYLKNNNLDINDYVPSKSIRLDKEANFYARNEESIEIINKINKLATSRKQIFKKT